MCFSVRVEEDHCQAPGRLRVSGRRQTPLLCGSSGSLRLMKSVRLCRFRLEPSPFELDDSSVCPTSPLSIQSAAAHCRGTVGAVPDPGALAGGASNADRPRLPICAVRGARCGRSPLRWLAIHFLRKYSRWRAGLPVGRTAPDFETYWPSGCWICFASPKTAWCKPQAQT